METLIKFKKTKIILADGGAFVGNHANVKPNRLNIANRAVKQMRKIIFGIFKSVFPKIKAGQSAPLFLCALLRFWALLYNKAKKYRLLTQTVC